MEQLFVSVSEAARLCGAASRGWIYRQEKRDLHAWAGVPVPHPLAVPAPDAPCFDVPKRKVMAAMHKAVKDADGWSSNDQVREALGLPPHSTQYQRPMASLVEKGLLECALVNGLYRHRLSCKSKAVGS